MFRDDSGFFNTDLYNQLFCFTGKGSINLVLKDELQRHPLNMEAPEILLSQSHTDAGSFLYFLHENGI